MSFSAKNHCGAYAPCTRACRSTKSASDLAAVVRFRSHADGAICYARFATSSRSSVNSSAHSAASRTELASVTAQSYSQEKAVEGGAQALLRQLPGVRVVGSSMGDPSSNRWGPLSRCTTVTQCIEVVTFYIRWFDAQRIKISPFTDPSNNERALDLRNRNSPRLCPHSTRVRH